MNALILSNDSTVINAFERSLIEANHHLITLHSAGEAIEDRTKAGFDLCILDSNLPEFQDSQTFQRCISIMRSKIPYLLMALPNESQIPLAIQSGANDFIIHPFGLTECSARIQYAVITLQSKSGMAYRMQGMEELAEEKVFGGMSACVDISPLKRTEELLRDNRMMFQSAIESMQEGLMVINAEGVVVLVNDFAHKTMGLEQNNILGLNYHHLPLKFTTETGEPLSRENNPLRLSLSKGERIRNFNLKIQPSSSAPLWVSLNSSPLFREDENEPYAVVITFSDITERKDYERKIARQLKRIERTCALLYEQKAQLKMVNERLEELVDTDGLTGAKNYRAFKERLTHEYDRAMRYGGGLSLVMIDVDRFKRYNDTYGHPAGDEVLKKVARMLQDSIRSTDMVARYGGEEFVILLPNTDRIGALTMAERFRKELQNADWENSLITASFGVATLTPATPEKEVIVEEADKALYLAKQSGRNCVKHFWEMTDMAPIAQSNAHAFLE